MTKAGLWASVMAVVGDVIGCSYDDSGCLQISNLNFLLTLSEVCLERNDRGSFRGKGKRSFDRQGSKGLAKGQSAER